MSDPIDRQAAINAFDCTNELIVGGAANAQNVVNYINKVIGKIKDLPSAKTEIIRCKDCKYHNEGYRRISVKWLPCMDICPGSNWYCGSAEERKEE